MNKSNEELHKEFQDALELLSNKLYNLLRYGQYNLEYVNRDIETGEVISASMRLDNALFHLKMGNSFKFLEKDGSEVTLLLPNNPVNQEILDAWDRQTVDKDIEYYEKKLADLVKQKEKLSKKYEETSST